VEAFGDDEMRVIKKSPGGWPGLFLFILFVTVFVFGVCCLQFRSRRLFLFYLWFLYRSMRFFEILVFLFFGFFVFA